MIDATLTQLSYGSVMYSECRRVTRVTQAHGALLPHVHLHCAGADVKPWLENNFPTDEEKTKLVVRVPMNNDFNVCKENTRVFCESKIFIGATFCDCDCSRNG